MPEASQSHWLICLSSTGALKKWSPGSIRSILWQLFFLPHRFQLQLDPRRNLAALSYLPLPPNYLRWMLFVCLFVSPSPYSLHKQGFQYYSPLQSFSNNCMHMGTWFISYDTKSSMEAGYVISKSTVNVAVLSRLAECGNGQQQYQPTEWSLLWPMISLQVRYQ